MSAGEFFSGLSRGFGSSYSTATAEKKRRKHEKEQEDKRLAIQQAQFAESMGMQRQRFEAETRRNDILDSFMMKRGDKEDMRLDAGAKRAEDLHAFELARGRETYDGPLADKCREAKDVTFDAEIANKKSELSLLPVRERAAKILTRIQETDLDSKLLDFKGKKLDLEADARMRPYREAIQIAQKRQAEAMAKKIEFETSDDQINLQRTNDYIKTLRDSTGLISDLANIAGAAEDRKLRALHLNAEQIDSLSRRYSEMVGAGVPKDVAKDLIRESYVVGHAIVNKGPASKMGTPQAVGEMARWYQDAM